MSLVGFIAGCPRLALGPVKVTVTVNISKPVCWRDATASKQLAVGAV